MGFFSSKIDLVNIKKNARQVVEHKTGFVQNSFLKF